MKVTIMLADFAQAVNGKLYIMGGGWSLIGPAPCPTAIAIKIEVPWNQTNEKHNLKFSSYRGNSYESLFLQYIWLFTMYADGRASCSAADRPTSACEAYVCWL